MRINVATVLVLAGVAPLLAQVTSSSRIVHVVVNDPMNRVVTGLSRLNFDVTEDGSLRPITAFTDADSPISLAIVAQSIPAVVMVVKRPDDEIIRAQSVADALRVLTASKNSRKGLIFTAGTIVGEIPSEIHVLKAGPQDLMKSVLEAVNSYSLWFTSSSPASAIEISLRLPAGLPPLTVTAR